VDNHEQARDIRPGTLGYLISLAKEERIGRSAETVIQCRRYADFLRLAA
jgi:hypothetical protein